MLRSRSPAAVLLLLAPTVGGLLNGATRLSFVFALVPQILVWGCGTLLIREVVLRWRGRRTSILALALALSIWVEFFVLQTSLAPLPWLSVPHDRVWGVNWLWLLFMLGYEPVWIVLVPISITELMFAKRREEAWLGPRGLATAALALALGSWMLWGLWTRVAMAQVFHMPKYRPSSSDPVAGHADHPPARPGRLRAAGFRGRSTGSSSSRATTMACRRRHRGTGVPVVAPHCARFRSAPSGAPVARAPRRPHLGRGRLAGREAVGERRRVERPPALGARIRGVARVHGGGIPG